MRLDHRNTAVKTTETLEPKHGLPPIKDWHSRRHRAPAPPLRIGSKIVAIIDHDIIVMDAQEDPIQ